MIGKPTHSALEELRPFQKCWQAIGICLATLWPVSIAVTEEQGAPDARVLEVHVLDDAGRPLEGAVIRVSIWEMPGERDFPNMNYTTDARGVAEVEIPHRLQILRLWPSKPGYVPEFINFARGTHDEGERIPERYEFRLATGTTLGGIVVDDSGNPISGVRVAVRAEDRMPGPGADPQPRVSSWLTDSFDQPTIVTDASGKWQIDNAPPPTDDNDIEFFLKVEHADYVSDTMWGELQREQGVTAADLRRGDARLVLSSGVRVSGIVVDSDGEPIDHGWVVWNDQPYWASGEFESPIESGGRFKTPPLPPGEHPLTVVAPDWQAERRIVTVTKGMEQLRFELDPGRRLEIHVVDQAGDPIPDARVYIDERQGWRGVGSLHNQKHSGVPDYGIPRRPDENGVYVWDWAPADAVTFSIGGKGFASQTVTLVPKDAPHIIELAPRLVATGSVSDAETGEPLQTFRAIPVIVFRPNFFVTPFRHTVVGRDGNYELPLQGSANDDDSYRVRIEADGYRTVLSEQAFGPRDGRVRFDVALEPAAAREGRVVDGDDNPVGGAVVAEGTPTSVPHTSRGVLDSGEPYARTADDGSFQLAATSEPVLVRVMHDRGYAEVDRLPDEPFGELVLLPWAHVSGQLLQDGETVGNQTIFFRPLIRRTLGQPRFQDSYQTRTDAEGRFRFDRVPPVAGSVRASLGPWRESPLTSSQSVPVEMQPGGEREIVLGGRGATITGTVVATGRDDAPLDRNWSLNYFISRDRGIGPPYPDGFPELSFDPTGALETSWTLDPGFKPWRASREHFFVKLTPEGNFRIVGVQPGTYDFLLQLYEQPAGCLVETVGEKVVRVEVSGEDASAGTVDLGEIEVACRAGPRVGSDMRAYEIVDARGRQQLINDLKGRHVLLHVWASWCAPCIATMPEIRATVAELPDERVTFVGLNVDADESRGRALAEKGGWQWAQNYLGDNSNMARQLAISSVPAYYLIDTEGRLAASSGDWAEIKRELRNTLQHSD